MIMICSHNVEYCFGQDTVAQDNKTLDNKTLVIKGIQLESNNLTTIFLMQSTDRMLVACTKTLVRDIGMILG